MDWEGRAVGWLCSCMGKGHLGSSRLGKALLHPFSLSLTATPDSQDTWLPSRAEVTRDKSVASSLSTPTSDILRSVESPAICPSALQHPEFCCCYLFFLCPCGVLPVVKSFCCPFVGFGRRVRLNAHFQSVIVPTWLFLDAVIMVASPTSASLALIVAAWTCCPETTK